MYDVRFYGGQFLLALPAMTDSRFDHSVIALCVHDENGALGIAVEEEMEGVGLRDLLESFDIDASGVPDRRVLRGGPIEPRRGFVLHSLDWAGQEMIQVGRKWGLSGSLDILKAIAAGTGPSRYLVALGYAGWGAGQLERELAAPGWYLSAADPRRLFDLAPRERWAGAFAMEGIDPAMLASSSGHA